MRSERIWLPVLFLFALAVGVAASLSMLHERTAPRIESNLRAWEMRQIEDLLPSGSYDNNIFDQPLRVVRQDPDAELLGRGDYHLIFRAFQDGQPHVAIIQSTSNSGYSGQIDLIVAVNAYGALEGVRITQHRETPGLGDQIEADKSNWISQFAGRRYTLEQEARWHVIKDGGDFDQITGATVSSRAVVKAVKDALAYFEHHRNNIFEMPAETQQTLQNSGVRP